MNIAFFTLSLNKGGAERVIVNMCNDFLIKNNNVTIITCFNDEPQYNLDKKINVLKLDDNNSEKNENKFKRFIRRRNKLKQIVKKINIDLFIVFLPEPCFISLSIKKYINKPIIISVRNDPKIEYSFLPYKIMMKLLYPKADGIVYQTNQAKEYFKFSKKLYNNGIVIPNPINSEFISFNNKNKQIKKEIVSVGRLYKQKNHILLINAFNKISDSIPDYNIAIYGEGEEKQNLINRINELQLQDRVILKGQVDNVKEEICNSTLFVMSSDFEGMPNALMEAMSLGLPVISTDCPCGGPAMLIKNNENGVLIDVNNEQQLSDAIIKVIKDKEFADKIGNNASNIRVDFAPNVIYKKWSDYINNVLNKDIRGE